MRVIHHATGQSRRIGGAGRTDGERGEQRERDRENPQQLRPRRHARAAGQNFTLGAVSEPGVATNSAIGLLPRKKVEAQNTPGKVRSSVL